MKYLKIFAFPLVVTALIVVPVFACFFFTSCYKPTRIITTRELKKAGTFVLQNNGYAGWEMGCNYTGKSDADDQTYLDCANGVVYKRIGESPSTTHFNTNDDVLNEKYCKKGQYATFTYFNPITYEEGKFDKCIEF